jgi:hypothetical protein
VAVEGVPVEHALHGWPIKVERPGHYTHSSIVRQAAIALRPIQLGEITHANSLRRAVIVALMALSFHRSA